MNAREFDDLLDAHFLDGATEAVQAQLAKSLRADAVARHRFVQAAFLEARLHAARASTSSDAALSDVAAAGASAVVQNRAPRLPLAARRLPIRLRHLDLAAVVAVVAIIAAGYCVLRPAAPPRDDITVDNVPHEQRPNEQGAEARPEPGGVAAEDGSLPESDGKSRRLVGFIQAVDIDGRTFEMAGRGESRTKFRVGVVGLLDREPTHVSLDGAPSTFEAAIRPRRRATVVFVAPVVDGADLWAWKVEVTSVAR